MDARADLWQASVVAGPWPVPVPVAGPVVTTVVW